MGTVSTGVSSSAAMYAAAFVQDDPHEIVASALNALPPDSGYTAVIQDVIRLYKEEPKDWRATWHELQEKWGHEDRCPWGVTGAHGSLKGMFNISARLNGAYIVLGMLYGEGDFDRTVDISTRAGQDSDCNPSTAAGVLGAMMGFDALPQHVKEAIAPYMDVKFSHTVYTIETASQACSRAWHRERQGAWRQGGRWRCLHRASSPSRRHPAHRSRIRQPDSDGWVPGHRQQDHLGRRLERTLRTRTDSVCPGMRATSWRSGSPEPRSSSKAAVRENGGILEVTVDGKPMGTRDMYLKSKDGKRPGWNGQVSAVWLTGLPDGAHTLRVTVTGEKNGPAAKAPGSDRYRAGKESPVTVGRIGDAAGATVRRVHWWVHGH